MKKVTLLSLVAAFVALFTPSLLTAQIAQGRIGEGSFRSFDGSVSQCYGLDFNNDGELEFAITSTGFDVTFENCYITFTWSENGSCIWTVGSMSTGDWDAVYSVPLNTPIGPNSNWASQGDAMIINMYNRTSWLPINQDAYIGFRILLNGNVHYGWAKVRVTGDATSGYVATWQQCAYATTPNTPIMAGSLSTQLSESTLVTALYPNPTRDIVKIDLPYPAQTTYQLYDIHGKMLRSDLLLNNEVSLSNLPAGIYFLQLQSNELRQTIRVVKQ